MVIVDETCDLDQAAAKITASKIFDNATSCSSENAIVVVDAVYDAFTAALAKVGGTSLPTHWEADVVAKLWPDGKLNRRVLARDIDVLIDELELQSITDSKTRFIAVPTRGIGKDHPLSGEKLSLIAALYRADDFSHAKQLATNILEFQGAGHSVGIHTADPQRAVKAGHELPVCRVIVNQAHCFATGGAFNNGLPFSLSMGCGSWGGNSIDENLHWKHFMNTTRVVVEIETDEPTVDDIFKDYWDECAR